MGMAESVIRGEEVNVTRPARTASRHGRNYN
jgi:hypothetical protein